MLTSTRILRRHNHINWVGIGVKVNERGAALAAAVSLASGIPRMGRDHTRETSERRTFACR